MDTIFLLLLLIILFFITWIILDKIFYSPKIRIKKLWNKIHSLSFMNKKILDNDNDYFLIKEKNKIGRFINSLLDYYFDSEEDKDYIEENKYTDDYIRREEFIIKKANTLLIQEKDWEKIESILNKN